MEWLAIESRLQGRAPEDISGRDGSRAAIGISREIDDGLGGGPHAVSSRSPVMQARTSTVVHHVKAGETLYSIAPRLPDDCRGHPNRESLPVQPALQVGDTLTILPAH